MSIRVPQILLGFAVSAMALAQQPCTIPVNVIAPELSAVPSVEASKNAAQWKWHEVHSKNLPEVWNWDRDDEARNFILSAGYLFPSWIRIAGLSSTAFTASREGHPVKVDSVSQDETPRRVVFIIDKSSSVSQSARVIEVEVISKILSSVRKGDTFGLLTSGGPPASVPIGPDSDAIRSVVSLPLADPRSITSPLSPLDAILEAATWLQPSHPGDSIFVIAMHLEGKSHARFEQVREAITAGRIRVFGIQLGWTFPPNPLPAQASCSYGDCYSSDPDDNRDLLIRLCRSSGGIATLEATDVRDYHLSRTRRSALAANGQEMYSAISDYYLLSLASYDSKVEVGLEPQARSQFAASLLLYPRYWTQCATERANTSH